MAIAAQKQAAKASPDRAVWLVPTAIRYRYQEDIRPALAAAMEKLRKPHPPSNPAGSTCTSDSSALPR